MELESQLDCFRMSNTSDDSNLNYDCRSYNVTLRLCMLWYEYFLEPIHEDESLDAALFENGTGKPDQWFHIPGLTNKPAPNTAPFVKRSDIDKDANDGQIREMLNSDY